jgi:hypothetical protein
VWKVRRLIQKYSFGYIKPTVLPPRLKASSMTDNWLCLIPSYLVKFGAPPVQAIPRRLLDYLAAVHDVHWCASSSCPPLVDFLAREHRWFCDKCQDLRGCRRNRCHFCHIATLHFPLQQPPSSLQTTPKPRALGPISRAHLKTLI